MDLKNKMATQVKKIPELDIMKFYGILFVVLGHIAMMYTPLSVIPHFANMSSFMAVVKNVIYAFHMPMFIFISGCIFVFQLEVLRRKITYKSLLRSKINRLLVPFFIIGFFWVLPVMSLLGLRSYSLCYRWFYFSNRSSSPLVRFNVVLGISSILFFANSLSSLWN